MTTTALLSLGLFTLFFALLLRTDPERRLLALWACCLLVPREFNAHWGPLSVSLTDTAFLAFLLPELPALGAAYRSKELPGAFWAFAKALPVLLAALTVYHLLLGGPRPAHFLLRDLLGYGAFSLLLLAVGRRRWVFRAEHLWTLGAALGLQTLFAVLVSYQPTLRAVYIQSHIDIHQLASSAGYFDPTNGSGPFTNLHTLRVVDFNGGFPEALGLLFFVPLLLAAWERLTPRRQLTGAATAVWAFYGALFIQSRGFIAALFIVLAACTVLWSGPRRRAALVLFLLFLGALLLTDAGRSTVQRASGTGEAPHAVSGDSRWPMWRCAAQEIGRHPIAGVGPGAMRSYPFGERTIQSDGVDSLYLTLALKWGLGALAFLLAWIAVTLACWRKAIPRADDFSASCSEALLPLGAAFLALGFLSYPLTNISTCMFLGIFLGLAASSKGL